MKKLISIAVLAITLAACQKEKVAKTPEMSIAPPPVKLQAQPNDPGGSVMLPVVILTSYPNVNVMFDWTINKTTGYFSAQNIVATLPGDNGNGWYQSAVGSSSIGNVLTVTVTGTYTYVTTGRFGMDIVKDMVLITITFNSLTGVKTSTVYRTASPTLVPR